MATANITVLLSLLLLVLQMTTVLSEAEPRIIYAPNGGQNNGFFKLPQQYQQKVFKYQDVQGKQLPIY